MRVTFKKERKIKQRGRRTDKRIRNHYRKTLSTLNRPLSSSQLDVVGKYDHKGAASENSFGKILFLITATTEISMKRKTKRKNIQQKKKVSRNAKTIIIECNQTQRKNRKSLFK